MGLTPDEQRMENIRPHQWQKGQSGNPAGYPKGRKNIKTIIRKFFDTEAPEELVKRFKEGGFEIEEGATMQDILVVSKFAQALSDEPHAVSAARLLLEYAEGKPTQPIGGDNENPFHGEIVVRFKDDL